MCAQGAAETIDELVAATARRTAWRTILLAVARAGQLRSFTAAPRAFPTRGHGRRYSGWRPVRRALVRGRHQSDSLASGRPAARSISRLPSCASATGRSSGGHFDFMAIFHTRRAPTLRALAREDRRRVLMSVKTTARFSGSGRGGHGRRVVSQRAPRILSPQRPTFFSSSRRSRLGLSHCYVAARLPT